MHRRPTPPREPIVRSAQPQRNRPYRTVAWRLVNMLSTNHLGLVEPCAGAMPRRLRETFRGSGHERRRHRAAHQRRPQCRQSAHRAAYSPPACRDGARSRGHRGPLTRRPSKALARFLLGAVLERYFAEYSGFNSFTQTVIRSVERGEIMRWPPRTGMRRPYDRCEVVVTFCAIWKQSRRFDLFHRAATSRTHVCGSARIGDSAARREDFVQLGQDPFMDFPASNLARVVQSDDKPLKVFVSTLVC